MHYPGFFGVPNNNDNKIVLNTGRYPLNYDKEHVTPQAKTPTILDIGCGYGGLIFELIKHFPDELILGMEIRDKVVNFVGEKVNSIRHNSGLKECMNGAAVRTNCMKAWHNYFDKESVDKIFFCFADPHFKKTNHRRRIINTSLITDYLYTLKPGGKIYTVTDVKDLHEWEVEKLSEHPMLERCDNDLEHLDVCEKAMREETDEAKKVLRNGGSIWHAVFRKRDLSKESEATACNEMINEYYSPAKQTLSPFD
jgi:tRNA (guanine-N7-)-methyltransferase